MVEDMFAQFQKRRHLYNEACIQEISTEANVSNSLVTIFFLVFSMGHAPILFTVWVYSLLSYTYILNVFLFTQTCRLR